jgi:hypothetical protein
MKDMKALLLLIFGIIALSTFNSCSKEDDPTPTGPTITVTSPSENSSYISGENVTLTFKATANDGIKRIVVKYCI